MSKTFFFQRIMTINFIFFSIGLLSCQDINKNTATKVKTETQTNLGKITDTFQFKKGITSIFEDSKGNFWFGTTEKGICKYDGKSYSYFTTKEGLPHKQISYIKEDTKGNILLKTGKGICSFDGKTFIKLSEPDTEGTENSWSLSKNDLWFQVNANGVLKYNGSKLQYLQYPFADKELTNGVHLPYLTLELYKDNSGKVWFGTFNKGVIEYDGINFKKHNPDNFGIGTIRAIFQDNTGNYWFGSNGGGLYHYDGKTYTNLTKKHNLVNPDPNYDKEGTLSRIWAINQDDKGNMWIGTADAGLWSFDGKTFTNYTMKDGLPSNFVDIIYKDSKGKLWFGSGENSNGILFSFSGRTFENLEGFETEK